MCRKCQLRRLHRFVDPVHCKKAHCVHSDHGHRDVGQVVGELWGWGFDMQCLIRETFSSFRLQSSTVKQEYPVNGL